MMHTGSGFPLLLAVLAICSVIAAGEATARSDPYEGTVTSLSPESRWIGIDGQPYRVSPDAVIEGSRDNRIELSELKNGDRIIYSVAPFNEYGDQWVVRLRRTDPGPR